MVSSLNRPQAFAQMQQARNRTIRLRSPLRWWKLVATMAFSYADTNRLARAVSRESADVLEGDVIEQGLGDDGNGAIRCSLAIQETLDRYTHQDLAMSWSLLAIAKGNRAGALMIVQGYRDLIARINFQYDGKADPYNFEPLKSLHERLLSWVEIAELLDVVKSVAISMPVPKPESIDLPAEPGPTLRPASRISDTGRRGSEFQRQYAGLTQEIPLRGGSVDVDRLEMTLNGAFPWLVEAIEAVIGDLRLRALSQQPFAKVRPTLLVGPPGVGKTAFAAQLADALGLPLRVIAGGATTHTHDLTGLSRIYESSQPSVIAQTMLYEKTANPVVVIDEVDKARAGFEYGRFVDALLTFLETETARAVPDECLLTTVDYSGVSWILTANDLSFLTKPLRDRLRIIHVGLPTADHWPAVFGGILKYVAREFNCQVDELPELLPEAAEMLYQMLIRGASLRAIRKSLTAALAAGLRKPPRH